MEKKRDPAGQSTREKKRREDVSCEEAAESAVLNRVLPQGLEERSKEPLPDADNGLT